MLVGCLIYRSVGDEQEIVILLEGEEVSDALNFVVKDAKINRWYDNNGSNFTVALKTEAVADSVADVVIPQVCPKSTLYYQ